MEAKIFDMHFKKPPVADTSEGLIFSVDTLKISLLPVAACDWGPRFSICTSKTCLLPVAAGY